MVRKMTPADARVQGIEVIYQEFNLIECLSVAENVCFGSKYGKLVNYREMRRISDEVFAKFGIEIDSRTPVYRLPSSKQQMVEIAKAITKDVKILIMDEPTAPLSVTEVEKLFTIVRQLKKQGVTVIYISHRLEEIFELTDKVTVLRDGKYITTINTGETNAKELIHYMVGRELVEKFPERKNPSGEVMLKVKNFSGSGDHDISFELRQGEILGIGGLVGAGRTELVRLLYGADKKDSGVMYINNKKVKIGAPSQAIRNSIGFIPEDRKTQGCLLAHSVKFNMTLSIIRKISHFMVINRKTELKIINKYIERLDIKTPGVNQIVRNLSGGNQQKVVVAKALATNCDILIFDEPTRGIDIGAKTEMYELISQLAGEGHAILLITSEMKELLGLSDRILVMYQGRIAGEILKKDFSQDRVLELASGI
jgi:ribose transport system ATP-binding protein